MIRLPQLDITRDELEEVKLYQEIRTWLEKSDTKRSDEIHATDLIDPRIAYWRRKAPKELSERQVWFFSVGKILHNLILILDETKTDEGTFEELGILYSPDKLQDGHPVELKTHRGQTEPALSNIQKEFSHYFEQLLIYCVLTNSLIGFLWVLFINLKDRTNRTAPEIRCYRVVLTEGQFYQVESEVTRMRDLLTDTLTTNNYRQLPLCRSWKCGTACGWWHQCQPELRYPNTDRRSWEG